MKSINILAVASIVLASPIVQDQTTFELVALAAPLNWLAGPSLFPRKMIASYHAELAEYEATDWADFVLQKCISYSRCRSTLSFSGE
jgi:hypothetical protein